MCLGIGQQTNLSQSMMEHYRMGTVSHMAYLQQLDIMKIVEQT